MHIVNLHADQYGADVVNNILKRYRSKPLAQRGSKSTPDAPRSPRSSHRRKIPLYPFKSRYGQQRGPLMRL